MWAWALLGSQVGQGPCGASSKGEEAMASTFPRGKYMVKSDKKQGEEENVQKMWHVWVLEEWGRMETKDNMVPGYGHRFTLREHVEQSNDAWEYTTSQNCAEHRQFYMIDRWGRALNLELAHHLRWDKIGSITGGSAWCINQCKWE